MIRSIHHAQITIPFDQESEARAFYCDFLGLQEIPKPASLQGRGGFWLQIGDKEVHIGTEPEFDRTLTKAHIAYLVDNLDFWRHRFADSGIEIISGVPIPGYDRFEFRDPFGNRVELIQSVAEQGAAANP